MKEAVISTFTTPAERTAKIDPLPTNRAEEEQEEEDQEEEKEEEEKATLPPVAPPRTSSPARNPLLSFLPLIT